MSTIIQKMSNSLRHKLTKISKLLNGVTSRDGYATTASFKTEYLFHKMEEGPNPEVSVSKEDALKYYRHMTTIRRIEMASANLYKEKVVRGFCHLYSGQEACAVGMHASMREQDSIITAYRCHGWTYLMGVSAVGVLAELAGRQSGCSRGKGGSMHMYAKNFFGGNGIVGAQVPVGAGVAFANKYLGRNAVCLALYGDGASNQGQVFEAYNLSFLLGLPCIFVCENNGYGMGTSVDRSSSTPTFYTRGDYISGIWVDGMDVLAVREATRFAIDFCLTNNKPIVLETMTYRYGGHSMSDPGTSYRSRDEISQVRKYYDPIQMLSERMLETGLATAEEIKEVDVSIKKEVDEAYEAAKIDTEIGLEELTTDIYSNPIDSVVRGTVPDKPLEHKRLGKAINASNTT